MTCIFGTLFDWQSVGLLFCGLSLITGVLLLFIPESPRWLITFRARNERAAQESIKWIYKCETVCVLNLRILLKRRHFNGIFYRFKCMN